MEKKTNKKTRFFYKQIFENRFLSKFSCAIHGLTWADIQRSSRSVGWQIFILVRPLALQKLWFEVFMDVRSAEKHRIRVFGGATIFWASRTPWKSTKRPTNCKKEKTTFCFSNFSDRKKCEFAFFEDFGHNMTHYYCGFWLKSWVFAKILGFC